MGHTATKQLPASGADGGGCWRRTVCLW